MRVENSAQGSAIQIAAHAAGSIHHLKLRGAAGRRRSQWCGLLGLNLPDRSGFVVGRDPRALPIGPDEWLVIGTSPMAVTPPAEDEAELFVDVSAAFERFEVRGTHWAEILHAGCGVDAGDERIAVGRVLRTLLGDVPVVIERTDRDAIDILCAASLSHHLNDWLAAVSSPLAKVA